MRVVLIDITVMHSMYTYVHVPLDGIVHLSELTLISKKATYNLPCVLFRESIVNWELQAAFEQQRERPSAQLLRETHT